MVPDTANMFYSILSSGLQMSMHSNQKKDNQPLGTKNMRRMHARMLATSSCMRYMHCTVPRESSTVRATPYPAGACGSRKREQPCKENVKAHKAITIRYPGGGAGMHGSRPLIFASQWCGSKPSRELQRGISTHEPRPVDHRMVLCSDQPHAHGLVGDIRD